MRKYVIRTETGEAFNAAGKARRDADAIAVSAGFEPFEFAGERTAYGSLRGATRLALDGIRNWRKLMRTAESGSLVLIQYPHYPIKTAAMARYMIPRARRKKGIRFIALVHDLDSLRGQDTKGAAYSDRRVLPLFDAVICHNEKMKAQLAAQGIPAGKLIPLGLFDYLTDAETFERKPKDGFAIAGNLNPRKCGYVLAWIRNAGIRRPVHLYGKDLNREDVPAGVTLHGAIAAEELPGVIEGGFGIVWDGPSAETCEGKNGNYVRYNNPHKLSLYLVSGMPVIVWDEAAVAGFVKEHGVGLTVGSLMEAEEKAGKVSAEEYKRMARKAREIGEKLRKGEYLRKAIQNSEFIIHNS